MAANKSMNQSTINFQNSYVRCKIGAPVVPVVKSINTSKKSSCQIPNFNDQNLSMDHRQIGDEYKDIYFKSNNINNESMNSPPIRFPSPPAYLANTIYGEEMLLPVQGYFCSICDSFFDTRDKAFQEHCSTKSHYENYINLYNESLKLQRSADQASASLDLSSNNDLGNNPLPIKIKIENTDTLPNNDKVKKPLSERLGAVKKNNRQKSKKKSKNQMRLFDGDYNKSVLQYLPKPSSHITPSRKVFVDDYNMCPQSTFGPHSLYNTPMYQNI